MSKTKNKPVTFMNGCAINRNTYYITAFPGNYPGRDRSHSIMIFYQHQSEMEWVAHHLRDWKVNSTCFPEPMTGEMPTVYALSVDGKIECYNAKSVITEVINDALNDNGDLSYGPLNRIRKLGKHLYVCGHGCQVYRRTKTDWAHCDTGLLQKEILNIISSAQTHPEMTDEERSEITLHVIEALGDLIALYDINGPSEEDLYVVGEDGFMAHYDGKEWERLRRITSAHLNYIHVTSPSELWVAGSNGTILRGNARDGFKAISRKTSEWAFLSITSHEGTIFLSGDDGVYIMRDQKVERLEISDQLDLRDVSHIEAKDGVLWALTPKKLVRFDGNQWECFIHPNNQPDKTD